MNALMDARIEQISCLSARQRLLIEIVENGAELGTRHSKDYPAVCSFAQVGDIHTIPES